MKIEIALGVLAAGLVSMHCHQAVAGSGSPDYGEDQFGGSPYAQHGPSPAYGGAYANYGGGNTPGITGRFNSTYGEYGANPGYGEQGAAAGYGTGSSRGSGTGYGQNGEPGNVGAGFPTRSPKPAMKVAPKKGSPTPKSSVK